MNKIYHNKDWLYNEYWNLQKSMEKIAREQGTTYKAIRYWMIKYNIVRRTRSEARACFDNQIKKKYKDSKWLYNQYVILRKNSYQIAREQGTFSSTILRWLKQFNIPRRSNSESSHLSRGNHVNLSQEAIEFIEGELLGDGHLEQRSNWAAVYRHGSKHKEYLEWLSIKLNGFGIQQAGKINAYYDEQYGCWKYQYDSLSYAELLSLFKKWYPGAYKYKNHYRCGGKVIPQDIKLTSLACRQWYIGDGSTERDGSILLSTYDFSINDVEFLVQKLNDLKFKATRQSCNRIHIWVGFATNFLKYIGPCPIKCYQYKWDIKK